MDNKKLVELNRKQFGLISVEDLDDLMEDLSENEKKQYVANIASIYDILEKEIKLAIAKQGNFIVRFAEDWEQTLLGRGGVSFGDVLLERFKNLKSQHVENIRPKEKFDKHDVI